MYNEKLEKLIEMALMDGEITAKEKKILIKKAENFRVDLDEFEMVLDARLYQKRKQISNEQINRNESNFIPPVSKSIKFGDIKKCPSCGSNVQSFQIKCADCDHEFRNIDVNSSIEKLFRKLNEAEDKRKEDFNTNNPLIALGGFYAKTFSGFLGAGKVDRKKMEIISTFPIPTTKNDILEFLALALPKARELGNFFTKQNPENKNHNAFAQVWKTKCEQIIMKAKFSMRDDSKALEEIMYYANEIGIK